MKQLPEGLNDQLEQHNASPWHGGEPADWLLSSIDAPNHDPEVDELVALALRLQSASPLQADTDFARQLEQRILMHNAALRMVRPVRGWSFPRLLRVKPVFGVVLSFCLLFLLLGTGVLVAAAQVTNPDNPLSVVKHWEQHLQISLATSPENRAELELQFARDQLDMLVNLTDQAHAQAYFGALMNLDQQLSAASRAIDALSAGMDHDRMVSELATLEGDARHTLRNLLPHLPIPERLVTTDELGHLGESVPRLVSVAIVLPSQPNGRAIISIVGDDIQPGAQLLVDNRLIEVRGSFQNGLDVFVANWIGNQHPQSIGILNPDGTAAQTTTFTLNRSDDHGKRNGNGDHGGNGNGNGGGD